MKQIALFAFVIAMAAQAQATSFQIYETCKEDESAKSCLDRGIKRSLAMKLNFHTDTTKEIPEGKLGISSDAPEVILMTREGKDGKQVDTYLAVYRVHQQPGSGVNAAAFLASIESTVEMSSNVRISSRGVNTREVTLVGEKSAE